jgi:hypothetical protein
MPRAFQNSNSEGNMTPLERLRAMARDALNQYQSALHSGEEPSYPQWADDVLLVCAEAEANLLRRDVATPGRTAARAQARGLM